MSERVNGSVMWDASVTLSRLVLYSFPLPLTLFYFVLSAYLLQLFLWILLFVKNNLFLSLTSYSSFGVLPNTSGGKSKANWFYYIFYYFKELDGSVLLCDKGPIFSLTWDMHDGPSGGVLNTSL